jgi:hypothetical protein
MTRTIKATAIIATVLIGSVSSAFAMDFDSATKTQLLSLGYSDAVVSQLSHLELAAISATMNNGSDADARQGVRSLVHHFTE